MKVPRLCALIFLSLALHIAAENAAENAEDEADQSLTKRRPINRNFFTGSSWYRAMGWCGHPGSRLLVGDFNGDRKSDLLCHDNKGKRWVALANALGIFTGTTWHSGSGWCGHGSQLLLGDFNGDGRTDMLCHDYRGGKGIAYATRNGRFTGKTWHNGKGWCAHGGSRLLIGDFNGDRRDDMLCHDNKHNYWVSFATRHGTFLGTSWHRRLTWCGHGGALLHVGDFNGDRRADVLCHDRAGNNWVMLASRTGHFNGHTSWAAGNRGRWCDHSSQLHLGDFNGDRRKDMLCHRQRDGYKWISIAHPNIRRLFTGTTWHRNMRWCTGNNFQLFVADFDGDGKSDMLCHGIRSGQKWISFNQYHIHVPQPHPVGRKFKKINRRPVCFQARGNRPGIFRYYGPSRIVNGILLVYRSGAVTCHYHNRNSYSRWGCGGHDLNVVVTDQYNYIIYPRKQYFLNKHLWSRIPGAHSKHSKSLFFSNAAAPFQLTQPKQLRIWYGEDLLNHTEGDNRGRVCVDVYAWFA